MLSTPRSRTRAARSKRTATKTTFYADELPEDIRNEVLDKYRNWNTQDEWWDYVYKDAKRMGALMGIEIDGISFSGFCSQGDGASFTGSYQCEPGAIDAIKAECNDEELIALATELTTLQVTFALEHSLPFECQICRDRSIYAHSNTMNVGDWGREEIQGNFEAARQKALEFRALMRRFADWIYESLKTECEYLESDECILESLRDNDLQFTREGVRIERRSK